jgi:hypothetical protein
MGKSYCRISSERRKVGLYVYSQVTIVTGPGTFARFAVSMPESLRVSNGDPP